MQSKYVFQICRFKKKKNFAMTGCDAVLMWVQGVIRVMADLASSENEAIVVLLPVVLVLFQLLPT